MILQTVAAALLRPRNSNVLATCALALCAFIATANARDAEAIVVTTKMHHLGDSEVERWGETSTAKPEGAKLELKFSAARNDSPWTLVIEQENVHNAWDLQLNGKGAGNLKVTLDARTVHLELPAGALVGGENTLLISPRDPKDDILVGRIKIVCQTLAEVLHLGVAHVTVLDARSGEPVPARVTIETETGALPELHDAASPSTAVRDGIFYTLGYGAPLALPAARYKFTAGRGTEWSIDQDEITVTAGATTPVVMRLKREVDTSGFVAADTHVHTLTFSGHGDASVEERLITLAGEGVELAIATDHNHHTDYTPLQESMGLIEYFKAVTGNEVTTDIGHMNAFPMNPEGKTPNHKLKSWTLLAREMRARGAQVIILNHPRWPKSKGEGAPHGPLTDEGLDRSTGVFASGETFAFDAFELINSDNRTHERASLSDYLLEDWFALQNHGYQISTVGSSDSHAVGVIVGQGRTYVPSTAKEPAQIDIDNACTQFREGRTTISLGIFATILVDDSARMGDLISTATGKAINVQVRVAAPSWVRPRTARIYLSGEQVATIEVPRPKSAGAATDAQLEFSITAPTHDAHLIAVVLGDKVEGAFWRTLEDFTMAVTNPVYLDADGDGEYTAPRDSAAAILQELNAQLASEPTALADRLRALAPAIGIQLADLAAERFPDALAAARETIAELAAASRLWSIYLEERATK